MAAMNNLNNMSLDGRYVIERQLGSGGMANVYKGRDLNTGRAVAIKILRRELAGNADLVRRFKNEAKAVSLLNHPNITKVYDVSVSGSLQYIVMEYIDGITLKEYMEYRKRPLTYKETLHFVMQVLAALQHAHDKGIVHRDIKPQNIMLLSDGSIKVMDFGIARFSRSENQTMTDKAIGSVHYISPEQARGNATDVRADIYSVGVMMYEMLSGHLPFESDSPVSVAIKQISEEARPLRQVNPSVPLALEAITARAMAKEPRDRYPSAREMMADLEEFRRNPTGPHPAFRPSSRTVAAPSVRQTPPRPAAAATKPGEEPTRYIERVPARAAANQAGKKSSYRQTQRKKADTDPIAQRKSNSGRTATSMRGKRSLAMPILAGVTAAFALGAVILIIVIFRTSGADMFTQRADVDLPIFTGMTWESIESDPQYNQFNFTVRTEYNAEYEAGVVYSQSPKPPKVVKEGAAVTLYVSMGTQLVSVPNVIGQDKNEAMRQLSSEGIVFKVISLQTEDQAEVGKVISLEPSAGSQVRSGDKNDVVTVTVGRQKVENETKVPQLVGLSQEDAERVLEENNLWLGNVTIRDDTSPKGTVLEQNLQPGAMARIGSSINVVVSSGAVPTARIVTVVFVNTVDEGDWTLTLEDGQTATYHTTAGVAIDWPVSFTSIGAKNVVLQGPNGYSQSAQVDFGSGGTDIFIGPVGGSYTPPATPSTPATDPVLPDSGNTGGDTTVSAE